MSPVSETARRRRASSNQFFRGLLLLIGVTTLALSSSSRPPSLDMGRALENERMVRRALGIDPFLPGSLGDVIDMSLYPRPQRLARRQGGGGKEKGRLIGAAAAAGPGPKARRGRGSDRYVPASSAASRHHVRTPSNVLAVDHASGLFLMVASFQTDFVFQYNLAEGLGHPEVFASHVSCDLEGRSACTELSGPWGMAVGGGSDFFVASFGTDRILILDLGSAKVLGQMGSSDELNGPEDLAMGPRGQFLFVSSYLGGEIVQYDVRTRVRAGVFAQGLRGPEGLALMQSGILVAACNTDHSLRFFDVTDGSEVAAFVGFNVSTRGSFDGGGNTTGLHAEDVFDEEAIKVEKPVDVVWMGGDRVLVTMPGAIGSFRLDRDGDARVHFEGFARLAGNEKLKTRHPSGLSALRVEEPGGSTLFVAGYDTQRVLIFQVAGPGAESSSAFELDLVATGRL